MCPAAPITGPSSGDVLWLSRPGKEVGEERDAGPAKPHDPAKQGNRASFRAPAIEEANHELRFETEYDRFVLREA